MPEVVAAFFWCEEVKDFAAELPEALGRSPGSVAEQFLQFGEGELDGVKVGEYGGR